PAARPRDPRRPDRRPRGPAPPARPAAGRRAGPRVHCRGRDDPDGLTRRRDRPPMRGGVTGFQLTAPAGSVFLDLVETVGLGLEVGAPDGGLGLGQETQQIGPDGLAIEPLARRSPRPAVGRAQLLQHLGQPGDHMVAVGHERRRRGGIGTGGGGGLSRHRSSLAAIPAGSKPRRTPAVRRSRSLNRRPFPFAGPRGAPARPGRGEEGRMSQTRAGRGRWPQARRDDIGRRFLAGESLSSLAARHDATRAAIRGVLRRGGYKRPPPAPAAEPLDEAINPGAPWSPHPAQQPPEGAWATWVFLGGRGAGKTRAGAEWLAERAREPNRRLALVGPTLHDVREVMIDGVSGLRALPGRERPRYEGSRRRLRWANGTVAYGFSAEDPDSLRGPQFHAAWADEFCAWRHPARTLAMLRLGLRLGDDPRLAITATPKPLRALRALLAEPSCRRTDAPTATNA